MGKSKKKNGAAQRDMGVGSPLSPREEPPLSPRQAVVVQFREGVGREPHYFAGRAEHVVTGHAARFSDAEELVAVLRQMLSESR